MNRILLFLPAVLLCAGCAARSPAPEPAPSPSAEPSAGPDTDFPRIPLGEGVYLRQIREHVFVATHAFPWPANSAAAGYRCENWLCNAARI